MTSTTNYPPREMCYHVSAFEKPIRYSAEHVAQMLNYADACDPTFSQRFDDATLTYSYSDALLMFFRLQRDEKGDFLCFY